MLHSIVRYRRLILFIFVLPRFNRVKPIHPILVINRHPASAIKLLSGVINQILRLNIFIRDQSNFAKKAIPLSVNLLLSVLFISDSCRGFRYQRRTQPNLLDLYPLYPSQLHRRLITEVDLVLTDDFGAHFLDCFLILGHLIRIK